MRIFILFLFAILFANYNFTFSQNIAVNTTGAAANAASLFEIGKGTLATPDVLGVLIPRVNLSATNTNAPIGAGIVASLLVYNNATAGVSPNNVVPGYYYWDGAKWVSFGGSGSLNWSLLGNAGTVDGTNFIGTTDPISLNFRVHNIAAGKIEDPALATYNTSFGYQSLSQATKGKYNTAMGYQSLQANSSGGTSGDYNTAIGYKALSTNDGGPAGAGQNNTAVGYEALQNCLTAGGFGNDAMNNTAIGSHSLNAETNGNYNTAVGKDAMQHTSQVNRCTGLGFQALGDENGLTTVTGNDNLAVGYTTLGRLSSGINNTCIGNTSCLYLTTGSDNTTLGYHAFLSSIGAVETGSKNIAIGSGALAINGLTGSNNTVIGYIANVNAAAAANRTAIGSNAYVTADNCMVLGSINGTNGAIANTNVGIGTTAPITPIDVNGTVTSASIDMRIGRFNGTLNGTGDAPGGLSTYCTIAPAANLSIAYGFAAAGNANTAAGRTVTDFNIGHFRFDSQAGSAGTITNVNCLYAGSPIIGGVKPTNICGLRIKNLGVAGITTNYGIFVETPSGATSNYAAIFQGGSVGIGVTNPTKTFEVVGSGAGLHTASFLNLGGYGVAIGSVTGAAYGSIQAYGAGVAQPLVLQSVLGGNVGIGSGITVPAEPLEVAGTIRATGFRCRAGIAGTTSNVFNINWTGAQADLWIDGVNVVSGITSDRRLKENIMSLADNALSRLMQLRPVSFRYKKVNEIFTGSPKMYEGFIADELQEIIPSAVNGEKNALTKDGGIQPQTLNLAPIVSVLTKAMQEQQKMIENLKAENEKLKINSEARISKLETTVQTLLQAKEEAKK